MEPRPWQPVGRVGARHGALRGAAAVDPPIITRLRRSLPLAAFNFFASAAMSIVTCAGWTRRHAVVHALD